MSKQHSKTPLKQEIGLLKTLYESGMSTKMIAAQVKHSPGYIYCLLKGNGIKLRTKTEASSLAYKEGRRKQRPNDFKTEDVVQLYRGGMSITKIAGKLNARHSTISSRLKSAGVAQRNRSDACKGPRPKSVYPSGGRIHSSDGYIRIWAPGHRRANAGYVPEHILVWEEMHRCDVPPGTVIHHINGIKDDNRPENLVMMSNGEHWKLIPLLRNKIAELEQQNILLWQFIGLLLEDEENA